MGSDTGGRPYALVKACWFFTGAIGGRRSDAIALGLRGSQHRRHYIDYVPLGTYQW